MIEVKLVGIRDLTPATFASRPDLCVMNFEGLTPQQRKFVVDLSKRILALENKLMVLQARLVKIDPKLTADLAREFKNLNLN